MLLLIGLLSLLNAIPAGNSLKEGAAYSDLAVSEDSVAEETPEPELREGILEDGNPSLLDSGRRYGSIKFLSGGTINEDFVHFSTLHAYGDDHLHYRGGREGEVLYVLDGFPFREPVTGSFLRTVPYIAISSPAEIEPDYSARHGHALSAVAGLTTIRGGSEYHGDVVFRGNDWQSLGLASDWYWGGIDPDRVDPYMASWERYNWRWGEVGQFSEAMLNLGAAISGPEPLTSYLLPEIGISIPGEMGIYVGGEFLETGGGEDGRYGFGFDQWETSWSGLISLDYHPGEGTSIDLSTSFLDRKAGWFGIGDYWRWSRYEYPYLDEDTASVTYGDTLAWGRNILYGLPTRFWDNTSIGMNLRQELGDELLLHLGIAQMKSDFSFKIRNDPESTDPMRQTQWLGEDWDWWDWKGYDPDYYIDYDNFVRGGTSRYPWREIRSTQNMIMADVDWNHGNHGLSLGIEGSSFDVFNYDIMVDSSGTVRQNRFAAVPYSGGAFLQDRIDLNDDLVMSLGMRMDYFDSQYDGSQDHTGDPPPPDDFQYYVLDEIQASTKLAFNPRLSFVYALSGDQQLDLAFGMYSQMPDFNQLYRREDYGFSQTVPLGGNPDLDFQRTTQYEIGFRQGFLESCEAEARIYFKDMSHMVETSVFSATGVGNYAIYSSTGIGESQGLEFSVSGDEPGFLSWSAGYTWSKSTGSSSHALQNYIYHINGYFNDQNEQYLDWDQRHTLSLDVAMNVPRGRGLRLWGVPVFQGMGFRFGWEYGSGFPITYYDQGTVVDVNQLRYPSTSIASLGITKEFCLDFCTAILMCDVRNLFNSHEVVDLQDVEWSFIDWGADGNGDFEYPEGPLNNPYCYEDYRMIRLGLGAEW